MYMVASKCSGNHVFPKKYKSVRQFKLYFIQNNPIVQLYISASDFRGVINIPRSHFVKAFSALPPHS